jgi:hypothetical protein
MIGLETGVIEFGKTTIRVPHYRRVQRTRARGRPGMPPGAVYVGRPTRWGNPFTTTSAIEVGYARDEAEARVFCVQCFAEWLTRRDQGWWDGPEADRRRDAILDSLPMLRGKPLACWCPLDRACHGDVLAVLANA